MSRREPRGGPLPEVGTTHLCAIPRSWKRAVIGLAVLCALLLAGLAVGAVYVYQQQEYVNGKGQQRDQENARLNQRINDAICDLLDQLPEGPLLDRPREKYGCGPGIPIDQFPPEIQNQLRPTPAPTPATVVPAQPSVEPSVPSAPLGEAPAPVSPEPPAGATGTMGRPEPPPLSPPSQIRELLCDVLGVTCSEAP